MVIGIIEVHIFVLCAVFYVDDGVVSCTTLEGDTSGCGTLGGAAHFISCSLSYRMSCSWFNCPDNVSNALRTRSPASRLGTVDLGGFVNRWTISAAACYKKSLNFALGKG